MATGDIMNRLSEQLGDYLSMRRALGYKLERVELLLGQFIAHLVACGTTDRFTIDDTISWATAPGGSAWWHSQRLSAVRGFAGYLHAIDPTVPVPPADLLPGTARRAVPYLYSNQDICWLIDATAGLRQPFRRTTYRALIGLLAAYFKRLDAPLMRLIDVLLSFPSILFGLAIAAVLGTGLTSLVIALSIAAVPSIARIARGAAASIMQQEYMEAGRAVGLGDAALIWRYLAINCVPTILI